MRINHITQKLGVEVVADAITLTEVDGSKWFVTEVSEHSFCSRPSKTVKLIGYSEELGRLELTIQSFSDLKITNLNSILKTFNKGEI